MIVFAIDPGTTESAFALWDGVKIWDIDKVPNGEMFSHLRAYWGAGNTVLVIEQIRSYGNAMGQSTIDTVFWSGRFAEAWQGEWFLLPRMEVKKHLCHNHQAKDSNVIQALVDRFAYGQPNKGKGTKKNPGFFYGFRADIWQAFALAVTAYDMGVENERKRSARAMDDDG
jgi:hypothetical protein